MVHVWFQYFKRGHFKNKTAQSITLDTSNRNPDPAPALINFLWKKTRRFILFEKKWLPTLKVNNEFPIYILLP